MSASRGPSSIMIRLSESKRKRGRHVRWMDDQGYKKDDDE